MNRIREIRESARISVDELAERVGTSGTQIRRLESGERRLTQEWMERLASALECSPTDFFSGTLESNVESDVEPVDITIEGLARAIRGRGLCVYRVKSNVLSGIGAQIGDVITVDESASAMAAVENAAAVLVDVVGSPIILLRQYLRPGLVVTNRLGANTAIRIGDRSIALALRGVVVRD